MTSRPRLLPATALLLAALLVASAGCDQKGGRESDVCSESVPCQKGLVCYGLRCMTPGQVLTAKRQLAAEQVIAAAVERKRQRKLLEASGVDPASTAERPAPEVAPGEPAKAGSIRVSHTEGKSPIFAACRADERLLGGGCQPGSTSVVVQASYPSDFDARDTLGARWNCVGGSDFSPMELQAYALCQRTVDAPPIAASGADAR